MAVARDSVCNEDAPSSWHHSHLARPKNPFTQKDLLMTSSDNNMIDPTQAREHLWELIHDIRFAMFTTHHRAGHLHSRPMTTQNSKLDEHNSLWFFMSRKGEPVADIAKDSGVNLAYVNPSDDTYVSVSGTAAVVEDQAKKEELWSKLAQAWFPGGVTDADLALVQVRIEHANYWDIGESKIVQLFHMATAAMTGKPPTSLGEHAEIKLN